MADVTIVEVGSRDGLHNEKRIVPTEDKLALIGLLQAARQPRLEVTAFISPKWVPQMADYEAVLRGTPPEEGLIRSVLVPNERGALAALAIGVEELAVFTSASETFAQKNITCSIAESIARFTPVAALARQQCVRLRGYVSCAVECPYEGPITAEASAKAAALLAELGLCRNISGRYDRSCHRCRRRRHAAGGQKEGCRRRGWPATSMTRLATRSPMSTLPLPAESGSSTARSAASAVAPMLPVPQAI